MRADGTYIWSACRRLGLAPEIRVLQSRVGNDPESAVPGLPSKGPPETHTREWGHGIGQAKAKVCHYPALSTEMVQETPISAAAALANTHTHSHIHAHKHMCTHVNTCTHMHTYIKSVLKIRSPSTSVSKWDVPPAPSTMAASKAVPHASSTVVTDSLAVKK